MSLTTAELSYLPDRRQAYDNLAFAHRSRAGEVGHDGAEPGRTLRHARSARRLRVLAQESRDQRMNEAEKKAAALPPKLTVPMILFFLPVLFAVIMMPALIQVFKWQLSVPGEPLINGC